MRDRIEQHCRPPLQIGLRPAGLAAGGEGDPGGVQATDSDVYWFLADWFPRKALCASVSSMRAYLASFKKFFTWMGEIGLVSPHIVTAVLDTLKFDRDEFLRKVAE
jgi:hypothetical protein